MDRNSNPPKKNASNRSRGSPPRARLVREIRKTSEKEWNESVHYGKRSNIEIYFSVPKRAIGEVIKDVKPGYIAQKIAMRAVYYNDLRHMTEAY